MKSILVFISLSLIFCLTSCKKEQTSPTAPANTFVSGQVLMKIDKVSIPDNVVNIIATLTRTGFDPLTITLNVSVSDSAEITFTSVPVGTWHLTLQANNNSNAVLYSGETDVTILENLLTQVYITLYPVSTGVGDVNIHVSWGSLITWNEYPTNPILKKFPQDSLSTGIQYSSVIYDNGMYKMWYSNVKSGFGIGYATSPDGIIWTRNISSPVLLKGALNEWDDQLVALSVVIRDGATLKMYYYGKSTSGEPGSTGLATSTDGIVWEKYGNPVLNPSPGSWDAAAVSAYSVVKNDSFYLMYYTGVNFNGTSAIGLAFSTDGIQWSKYSNNPIMAKTEEWEGYYGIYCPSVIFDNGIYKMVYMSNDYIPSRQAFGYATSLDGKVWKKASSEPFFRQDMTANLWARIEIAYPMFYKFGSEYRIYFNGHGINGTNDWAIGLLKGK